MNSYDSYDDFGIPPKVNHFTPQKAHTNNVTKQQQPNDNEDNTSGTSKIDLLRTEDTPNSMKINHSTK